jgi:C4-dicarboxylate-specific signal transduction histidine kinase
MIFELLVAIFIVRYLRQSMNTQVNLPKWDRVLNYIFYAAIVLLVAYAVSDAARPVTKWLSHALLLYLIYILYKEKEFRPARPVLLAIAPFIILSLFSDITRLTNEKQFGAWKSLLSTALAFSIVWMIVMWFITNKQKKALDREKIKTKEESEQKKILASLKDELEVKVAERTAELTRQKEELQHALEELKATQSQLIQSEKMASLGELTAGIAHEIQNPLNFVNNFSDVNTELIEELKAERLKPEAERDGQIEDEILSDIKANEEKINHHGKRADAIVKGMLQHSRKSTGQKEPTDINALCDEYLRLSYHGLRAKDKSFNATLKTDFDESVHNINVIPQDIGRVLLNLFNNAFYAVSEKQKAESQKQKAESEKYEPTVSVSTKKMDGKVQICVKDNGSGIPQNIMDKIFQPFFTTKPTGEGTGLGLSLSYDIIKAHGGTLNVETDKGEGTEFIILLPV